MLGRIHEFLNSDVSRLAINASSDDPSDPELVFPGSFNPLHPGHLGMAAYATRRFERQVVFEISVTNVDKPPLRAEELGQRLRQFSEATVWLTKAPTFAEKSSVFPGATFLLGADTVRRLTDIAYYRDEQHFAESINQIVQANCRIVAFGRLCDGTFLSAEMLTAPPILMEIMDFVPEAEFRCDVSSAQLRAVRKHDEDC